MKEYIITVTAKDHSGRVSRQVHRVWGYTNQDAKNRLRQEIGHFSTVKTVEA